jgi:histidine triad (HIT) family protein
VYDFNGCRLNVIGHSQIEDFLINKRRNIMNDCIFCKIVKGEIPCFKVYEDDRVLAFEDINPISEGHTLIIPKRHAENLWDITGEDLTAVQLAAKKIINALKDALKPTGVAALQLNGKGASQVVMHYHLHLIPRLSGTQPLSITEWEIKPGNMEAIKAAGEKIAAAIR